MDRHVHARPEDELGVILDKGPVTRTSIPAGIAGEILSDLQNLTRAVASWLAGATKVAKRGKVARVPGVSGLALVAFDHGGSVKFTFTIAAGEEFRLAAEDEGHEGVTSGTVEAVAILINLIEQAASPDSLVETLAEMPPRITSNYLGLVETLSKHKMESTWVARGREPVTVRPEQATAAKVRLEQVVSEAVEEFEVTGHLSALSEQDYGFRLVLPNGDEIKGTYDPAIEDALVWRSDVVVNLRRTTSRAAGHPEREHEVYELIDMLGSAETSSGDEEQQELEQPPDDDDIPF